MNTIEESEHVPMLTDWQQLTRDTLLSKIAAQTDALVPDLTGSPRAHEIALTLVQLAAAYAAIVGSENE